MQRGKYSPEKIEKKERDDTFISVPLLVKMLQTAREELKRRLLKAIIVYRKTVTGITAVSVTVSFWGCKYQDKNNGGYYNAGTINSKV